MLKKYKPFLRAGAIDTMAYRFNILVWAAVRKGGKWLWLFPAAILLHALVDGIAVVLSKSAGMVAVEVIICAMAVAVGATGWMLGRKLNESTE